MVTPDPVWDDTWDLLSTLLRIWIGLFSFSGLLLTLRIIIWTINDYYLNKGEGQQKETTPPSSFDRTIFNYDYN